MLWAGLGAVGLVLMFFGAKYARSEYFLRKPSKIWVPLALRPDLSMAEQKKLVEQIDGKLREGDLLRQVVLDAGLQEKFKQPTEDAAVKELKRRLFVEIGSADTPTGSVPSINIGVSGTGHERKILGEASTRIFRDVCRMIGIDPDTGKQANPGTLPPADIPSPDAPAEDLY
jgi:hypothetical protein